jgi:hypothetical protein
MNSSQRLRERRMHSNKSRAPTATEPVRSLRVASRAVSRQQRRSLQAARASTLAGPRHRPETSKCVLVATDQLACPACSRRLAKIAESVFFE